MHVDRRGQRPGSNLGNEEAHPLGVSFLFSLVSARIVDEEALGGCISDASGTDSSISLSKEPFYSLLL